MQPVKRSSGYPNRIRTTAPGGVDFHQSGDSTRKKALSVLVALCAVAALILGVANRCNQRDLEQKLAKVTGENGLAVSTRQKKADEENRKRFLKKIKRVKPAEADSGAHALPPQEPGPVDLGSHIKIVVPPKTK
jgi:hypothetical protein